MSGNRAGGAGDHHRLRHRHPGFHMLADETGPVSVRVIVIVVLPEMRAGGHVGRPRVEVDVLGEGDRGVLRVSRFRAGRRG